MSKLHIVSILDRSGSMSGTETEVIGAYNAFIKEQRDLANKNNYSATATLILFDDKYEQVYIKLDINKVPILDYKTYYTRGMTALYDAVGKTINEFTGKKKVQFFIETDGFENCSKEFDSNTVKNLIKQHDKWDFNFVGADLSKAETNSLANSLGIALNKTIAFSKSATGYATRNATFVAATSAYMTDKTTS